MWLKSKIPNICRFNFAAGYMNLSINRNFCRKVIQYVCLRIVIVILYCTIYHKKDSWILLPSYIVFFYVVCSIFYLGWKRWKSFTLWFCEGNATARYVCRDCMNMCSSLQNTNYQVWLIITSYVSNLLYCLHITPSHSGILGILGDQNSGWYPYTYIKLLYKLPSIHNWKLRIRHFYLYCS